MLLNACSVAAAVGVLCGIISGFGIGGGSVLMVWMTAVLAMEQRTAQGINLLYFLPTAAAALIIHIREKRICRQAGRENRRALRHRHRRRHHAG